MTNIDSPFTANLTDLLPEAGAENSRLRVSGLCLDSRQVTPGDVFFAVKGAESDGRKFVKQAVERGAIAVVADAPFSQRLEVPVVAVENLNQRLSDIAGRFYKVPSANKSVFAVTGTNGKTSCVWLIAQVVSALKGRCSMLGTLGSATIERHSDPLSLIETVSLNTTPDALTVQQWLAESESDFAAMEVSSHALAQGRVKALKFAAAIFTNLTSDHLDYHGTREAYGDTKAKLFREFDLPLAVFNADDPFCAQLAKEQRAGANKGGQVVTFGKSNDADVFAVESHFDRYGTSASVVTPWGDLELQVPLLAEFNLQNVLAVVATLGASGFSIDDIAKSLQKVSPVPGRMQLLTADDGLVVVVDFAHSQDALSQALKSLRALSEGRLWCVFGCGGDRDKQKRPAMGATAQLLADAVVLTSDNPRSESPGDIIDDILVGMSAAPAAIEADRAKAITHAIKNADARDIVLIAGKGHETYQEINKKRTPFSDVECALSAMTLRMAA